MKKISIIGAGPGGLAAGMILTARGYDVTIFEKSSQVGGRSGVLEKNGFSWDIGPTFFIYPEVLHEVFRLAGDNLDNHAKIVRLDPMYQLSFSSGKTLNLSDNPQTMRANIEAAFPGEVSGYNRYMAREGVRWNNLKNCLKVPYGSISDFFSTRFLSNITELSVGKTVYDVLSDYFQDEEIKLAFSFQSKYLGMSPWECPGVFTILAYLEHIYGVWHVEWGLSKLADAMATVFEKNGGKLRLNTPIKTVETVKWVAKAIILKDSERIESDVVVINADFAHAMSTLFDQKDIPKYTNEKLGKKGYSCSTYMLYLGLDTMYPNEPHHHIIFAENYKKSTIAISQDLPYLDDFSVYVRNASITDPTIAPAGKSNLYVLVPVPNTRSGIDWSREKDKFRNQVLDFIEKKTGMQDLRSHIVEEYSQTPDDWERSGVYNGATFNLTHSLDQMLYFRPHNEFESVKNCYLVGGGTHPGSGLPTIYQSAIISADLIEKKFKK